MAVRFPQSFLIPAYTSRTLASMRVKASIVYRFAKLSHVLRFLMLPFGSMTLNVLEAHAKRPLKEIWCEVSSRSNRGLNARYP